MKRVNYRVDLCVIGGGLAGLSCAIAAARHGIKVLLLQDRPVLGGNASGEIRMWVCGAHGEDMRETGIIEELILKNYYYNKGLKYPLWDGVMYGAAMEEENLTLLLNSSVFEADTDGATIKSVTAWQSNAETYHKVEAKYFADCSGDSIMAPLTGALYRYGREAKSEFNETIPPDVADKKTMGMSCMFQLRENPYKTEFIKPEWANTYETDEDLPFKDHEVRDNNFWWIELGGTMDCIHDTDKCRHELLKICYGVWDHIKNKGDHGADNWEMEWIGFLPGKRESRRYIGEYTVTQNDVQSEGRFSDIVAYAGWSMDDHFPEGFQYKDGHPTIYHPAPSPWGLPLRCMISKNIKNLTFAGRNISVTHATLSSSRVMATCAILGQALGTAISQSVKTNRDIREIDVALLQQTLMEDDCYIPWHQREISKLSSIAKCNADIVRNGIDRGEENCWKGKAGEFIEYIFNEDTTIEEIKLVFDSNLNRDYHNMPCCYQLNETRYILPETLIKKYRIEGFDSKGNSFSVEVNNSHERFVKHRVGRSLRSIRFIPLETYGSDEFRVFSFEVK